MRGSGKMIKHMAMVIILMQTVQPTKVNGKTTNNTAKEPRPGQTELNTTANTTKAKSITEARSHSQMGQFILGISCRMRLVARVAMYGQMERPMKGNGKRTKCTATES